MDVEMLDCLFQIDDQQDQGEDAEEEEDTRHVHDVATATNPVASHGETVSSQPCLYCDRHMCADGNSSVSFSSHGLVCSGVLEHLLDSSAASCWTLSTSPVVQLSGHMTVTCHSLTINAPSTFLAFRQQLNLLLHGLTTPITLCSVCSVFYDCVHFLHFTEDFVFRHLIPSNGSCSAKLPHTSIIKYIKVIITQLTNVSRSLGPLEDILSMLRTVTTPTANYARHVLLQLCWTKVAILYRLVMAYGEAWLGDLLECCGDLIKSLLIEGVGRFDRPHPHTSMARSSLFQCPCVLEVWLIVRLILDCTGKEFGCESFWAMLSRILSTMISHDRSHDYEFAQVDDPLGYAWWVVCHMTTVYWYSSQGVVTSSQERTCPENWSFINKLLSIGFNQPENQTERLEVDLRWQFSACIFLLRHWSTMSMQPLVLSWDYYHKHLNSSFMLPQYSVRECLRGEGTSSKQWFEHIRRLSVTTTTDHLSLIDGQSFDLFLRMVACYLSDNRHGDQIWKQLRGRIYSKLTKRRIQVLSNHGLQHLITLFLLLANCRDTKEAGCQLYTHLSLHDMTSSEQSQLPLLWKGVFAMLLVYQARGVELSDSLVMKVKEDIAQVCNLLIDGSVDPLSRPPVVVETVGVILDGIQEVIITNTGGVVDGAEHLLGEYIGELIVSLDGAELRRVVGLVSSLVSAMSLEYDQLEMCSARKERLQNLMSKLIQYCSTAVIQRATDPIPLPTIASTAAAFAIATCQWSTTPDSAFPFLSDIGFSLQTTPQVTSAFLRHVISSDVAIATLLSPEQSQAGVCSAWLRCVVCTASPLSKDPELQQLTRLLPRLSLVQEILLTHNEITDPLVMLQQLLRGIVAQHRTATSVERRSMWKSRLLGILGDLTAVMEPALSGAMHADNMKMCYRIGSIVVRHCAKLIYSKMESRCLLPQLLNCLILPLTTKRPPPQGMAANIRAHLHHFLAGLFQLDPDRDEFVNRKLKQIFSRYFHTYIQPPNPLMQATPNPFMLLLHPCFGPSPPVAESDNLINSVKIISAQELTFTHHPAALLPAVKFLDQVLEKISHSETLSRCSMILVGKLLSCLLCCELVRTGAAEVKEKLSLQKHALASLKLLIQVSLDHLPCSKLLPIIRNYLIQNHIDHKELVFKPLVSIASYNVTLSRALLPVAVALVGEAEAKIGFGHDQLLRHGLAEFEKVVSQLHETV